MRRLIMLLALIVVAMVSIGQDREGKVVTGATTLKYPINFTSADSIVASDTVYVIVNCKQNYAHTQSVTITLDSISGAPSIGISLEGKTSEIDDYTEIVAAATWNEEADNPFAIVVSAANKYRYFKIKLISTGATQKAVITALTFTDTYQNTTSILATTAAFSGDVLIGQTTANETTPSLTIKSDADSDAGGDTNESLIIDITPNATPTSATWGFTSTQSAGYTFDKNVTFNGGATLGAGDDLIGSATSDITINTDKFTVAGATGNTAIAGTLGVTGAQSNSSTVTVTKDGDNVVIDPSTDLHVIDVQINSASKFNIDTTGIVNTAGQIKSANGVDLGTSKALTGTTGLTVGAGTETVAINSSDWDITATGVATGLGAITSNGKVTTSDSIQAATVKATGQIVGAGFNFASASMVTGAADSICVTNAAFPTLAAGVEVSFIAEAANTTATRLDYNGTVDDLKEYNGAIGDLDGNDIRSGQYVKIAFDGTQWVMMSPSGN